MVGVRVLGNLALNEVLIVGFNLSTDSIGGIRSIFVFLILFVRDIGVVPSEVE